MTDPTRTPPSAAHLSIYQSSVSHSSVGRAPNPALQRLRTRLKASATAEAARRSPSWGSFGSPYGSCSLPSKPSTDSATSSLWYASGPRTCRANLSRCSSGSKRAILPSMTRMTADAQAAAHGGLIESVPSGATSVLEHQYVHDKPGVDDGIYEAATAVGSRMCLSRG